MELSVFEQQYRYCPTCKTDLIRKEIDRHDRWFCPSCGFIFWNNPKPVTSIILHNVKQEVLMIQRAQEPFKDYWVLPGGFIDYEEHVEEALKREVKEEIGVLAEVRKLVGVYRIDDDPRGVNIDLIYEGQLMNTEIQLSEEHSVAMWFDKQNLPEHIAYKHRDAILDFFATISLV